MALIFATGFEDLPKEIDQWKEFNEKRKNTIYPDLICVVEREPVKKYLGLIIAETPSLSLIWSAWIDKDIQVGDVVMESHGYSFFVHRIDLGSENNIIWVSI